MTVGSGNMEVFGDIDELLQRRGGDKSLMGAHSRETGRRRKSFSLLPVSGGIGN